MFHSRYLWLWLLTPDGILVEVNNTALGAVGQDRANVVWQPLWETPWFQGDPAQREQLRQAIGLASAGEQLRYVNDVYANDGLRRLDLNLRPYSEPGGAITLLILEGGDVSELQRRDEEICAQREEREQVLAAIDAAVVVHETDLTIRYANAAARHVLSLTRDDTHLQPELRMVDEEGKPLALERAPATLALEENRPIRGQIVGLPQSDGTAWLQADARPLHRNGLSAPDAVVVVYHDVTELRRQRTLLERHAQLDALTSLPNRPSFFAEVTHALEGSKPVTVMLLDLDDFRRTNDAHGSAACDRLLRWVGRRLERSIRPDDFAARLGSDEFALLLRGVQDEEGARLVADRVARQFDEVPRLNGTRMEVSASMGLAVHRPGHDAEALMRDAGVALARAQRDGQRGAFVLYEDSMDEQRTQPVGMASELQRATEEEQLDVYFQPLVDAKNHEVVGTEALMRWRHPERGFVSPAEFIPAAERTGQIVEMEAWLLERALKQLKQWNRLKPALRLSLNVSARQLERPDFVEQFGARVAASGVTPGNLIVEVTETFAMQHPREAAQVLQGLADLGVRLAIDDFGTGYSNLGQLQHLPFEIVKIDRGFLRDVPENQRNFALVRTIIAMAQSLDLTVIAEGVETKTQADFLYWEGATWLQGFHFGRPMPAATFSSMALGGAMALEDKG